MDANWMLRDVHSLKMCCHPYYAMLLDYLLIRSQMQTWRFCEQYYLQWNITDQHLLCRSNSTQNSCKHNSTTATNEYINPCWLRLIWIRFCFLNCSVNWCTTITKQHKQANTYTCPTITRRLLARNKTMAIKWNVLKVMQIVKFIAYNCHDTKAKEEESVVHLLI